MAFLSPTIHPSITGPRHGLSENQCTCSVTSLRMSSNTRRPRTSSANDTESSSMGQILFPELYSDNDREREEAMMAARVTRRFAFRSLGIFFAMSAAARMGAAEEDRVVSTIRRVRNRLDEIDELIASAKWDSVRTLLKSQPIRDAQDAMKMMANAAPNDTRGIWVGLREDALSSSKLLDAAVYSNVFVDESREILGTKVDYDTPRVYLQQLKATYDELAGLASERQ